MNLAQIVYWSAPLWQVVLVFCFFLFILFWLSTQLLRSTDFQQALLKVNPDLNQQPIFYFTQRQGVVGLSHAAQKILNDDEFSSKDGKRDVLVDLFFECLAEKRIVQDENWSVDNQTLLATPVWTTNDMVTGVFAFVVTCTSS